MSRVRTAAAAELRQKVRTSLGHTSKVRDCLTLIERKNQDAPGIVAQQNYMVTNIDHLRRSRCANQPFVNNHEDVAARLCNHVGFVSTQDNNPIALVNRRASKVVDRVLSRHTRVEEKRVRREQADGFGEFAVLEMSPPLPALRVHLLLELQDWPDLTPYIVRHAHIAITVGFPWVMLGFLLKRLHRLDVSGGVIVGEQEMPETLVVLLGLSPNADDGAVIRLDAIEDRT
jgi:hypothetical protein